jgi:CDP-4-dehydro-6-deoxyglucose reductase
MTFKIEIQPSGVHFLSDANILSDALAQSIHLEYSCMNGDCGACSAEVLSGSVENEFGEVVSTGNVLTCKSKPKSDAVLKTGYYPELASIKQKNFPCKVTSIKYATDDIVVINFRYPPTISFDYLSGQYVDLSFKGIKRSYSIAKAKAVNNELELHIRWVPDGKMSELLFAELKENQLMNIEGPKGTFFIRKNIKPLILIATGTGIAPIKAIVEQLIIDNDKRDIYIYWGMQYAKELYCTDLEQIALAYKHIHFRPVLSREEPYKGHKGYVQDVVCEHFESLHNYEVYACGSLNMIDDAAKKFEQRQLPSDAFHSDAFTPAKQI